jgi:pilus assembly protein CpaE
LDSGFDDYLVKSPGVVPLLKAAIEELLGNRTRVKKEGGLLIAFYSAKGGLGTSSLCANLASCMAAGAPDQKVVVVDLVLPMGSIGELVGYDGKKTLEEISRMPGEDPAAQDALRDLPRIEHWYFRLLAGSPHPERASLLNSSRIEGIVSGLKSEYDCVVLDVGRSMSRISLPLMEAADVLVMVASTDEDSVRLTKNAWDYLQTKGIEPTSVFLVLNRPVQVEGMSKEEVEKTIGLTVKTAFPYLTGNLSLANRWHQPFSLKFPNDAGALIFKRTAEEIVAAAKHQRGW